jgi:hypothetical protein
LRAVVFIMLAWLLCLSCQRELHAPEATVITTSISSISDTTASGGGEVTDDAGEPVTVRGICWSTFSGPVVTGNHTTDGSGTGIFASALKGLLPNTTYYVRAYASNYYNTAYGNEVSFTTSTLAAGLPTVTTDTASLITQTSATSGGNVTADGGFSVTARGVCWGTSTKPDISGNHTTDGSGLGTFSSALTALSSSVIYYARAYAINGNGTAYGNEVSFAAQTPASLEAYVAGTGSTGAYTTALLWKNGVAATLPGGLFDVQAASVFVSGTDVYVAGSEDNGNATGFAKLWKNGTASALSTGNSVARSVYVSGTDVYVAGSEKLSSVNTAMIWKNGVAAVLSTNPCGSEARSVFVSGTDVYAGGIEINCTGPASTATVWKNGAPTFYTGLGFGGAVQSVFVSGTDVYACGLENTDATNGSKYVAKLWKNGTGASLSVNNGVGRSVYVSGTDVYVAGYEENTAHKKVAKIWKNGIATALSDGTYDVTAQSVFVYGTDVYVAGYAQIGAQFYSRVWKNGALTSLVSGAINTAANSIFIK